MLRVDRVHSGYGNIEVLHGVSLHVEESEIVAVIGPNGAGKSTVLKTIMGFLDPTRGRITFEGEDITGLKSYLAVTKGISYIPQGRIVFHDMTVQENLEMGGYTEKDKGRLREALERVYSIFPILEERKDQRAGSLSGGEQQMLAMGRGLVLDPKLVLLDEPSLGLAPKFVDIVFDKIVEMAKLGKTMIIVEQNAARALEIADRGYVLELGRNRYEGTGKELLDSEEVRRLYLGG